jgi:hypothetical protein
MKTTNPVERLTDIRHEFGEHGGVNMSIEVSTAFTVMKPGTMPELFEGHKAAPQGCYLYGRHFNPTVYNLGRQLAAIEGTEAAYCTASGMAAISAALLQLCDSGDHIVASNTVYGGSYALMHDFLPKKSNIGTSFVDVSDIAAVEAAITNNYLRGEHLQPDSANCQYSSACRTRPLKGAATGNRQHFQPADPLPCGAWGRCGGKQHDKIHQWRIRHHCRCGVWKH